MLQIEVPDQELFNAKTNRFIKVKKCTLKLEHSLLSISKWESKWKTPFFENRAKTAEEVIDYIKCMSIDKNVQDEVYDALRSSDFKKINDYINDPHTATTFSDLGQDDKKQNGHNVTSEEIYFYMTAFNIPFDAEKWHINRLITLIRICSIKNNPKKMGKNDFIKQRNEMNMLRRAKRGSKG